MPTLYELAPQFRRLMERAETADDITEEEMADLLMTQDETTDKLQNYAIIIKALDAQADTIDGEMERLKAWKTRVQNNADRMKAAVETALDIIQVDHYDTKEYHIGFFKSTATIADAEFVVWATAHGRADLLTVKDPTPALKAIKTALGKGEAIPAHLEERRNLKIK